MVGRPGAPEGWGLAVGGGAGKGLGDFEEAHADLEECVVHELGLGGGEVSLGFLGEDGEHVDALARSHEVDLGLLARLGCAAELQDGGHVDGVDDLLEAHGGGMVHAGVGGADGGVEVVGGLLVGGVGLLHLAGGWRGRKLRFGGRFWGGRGGRLGRGGRGVGGLELERRGGGGRRDVNFTRLTRLALGGWIGVGARGPVGGELAAVGDDEGLVLIGHGQHSFGWFGFGWCNLRGVWIQTIVWENKQRRNAGILPLPLRLRSGSGSE